MRLSTRTLFLLTLLMLAWVATAATEEVQVNELAALAAAATGDGQSIRLEPGVYRMADYLTDEVLADIRE